MQIDAAVARQRAWERLAARTRATGDSTYETEFVERVLSQVAGLDPEMVSPQRTFRTAYGRDYRVDFTIEDGNVRIAVEVDGYDKSGSGSGMTREEHDAWVAREGDLRALGWTFFRTSNRDFIREPLRVAATLGDVLRLERQLQNMTPVVRPTTGLDSPAASSSQTAVDRSGRRAVLLGAFTIAAIVVLAIAFKIGPWSASSAPPLPGPAARACPSAYPIKGNVSQSGSTTGPHLSRAWRHLRRHQSGDLFRDRRLTREAAGFRPSSN